MGDTPTSQPTNQKPVGTGLFTVPANELDKPKLIGSKCSICGEVVFPQKRRCPNCSSDNVREILIGPAGKLFSFTVMYQQPPVGYKGPVPYGVVKVEMPEGTRITGYCTENDPGKLKVGMPMELIIENLFTDDEGQSVIGYKFKPAASAGQ